MLKKIPSPGDEAALWHKLLPNSARESLNEVGIADAVIDRFTIGWNGNELTIPFDDASGEVTHIEFVRLSDLKSTKRAARPEGALFGWDTLNRKPTRVVVCDSVGNRLLLESRGFPAVALLDESWPTDALGALTEIREIYAVNGAEMSTWRELKRNVPRLSTVRLPDTTQGGGLFQYFIRLRRTPRDFERLLSTASHPERHAPIGNPKRAARARKLLPIAAVIGRYTDLEPRGNDLVGACPLHGGEKPSLHVYATTNRFHCFECDADGDAIAFLMEMNGMTEGQAIEALERMKYDDGAATGS